MNTVILMGRLTKDVELRTTPNGVPTCSFILAVDRKYKDADGQRQADFIPCVAWRNTADFIAKYFSKGNKMVVSGSVQTRTWDDQDGKKHYITEVVVDNAEFCESKGNKSIATEETGYNDGYFPVDDNDEGIPF